MGGQTICSTTAPTAFSSLTLRNVLVQHVRQIRSPTNISPEKVFGELGWIHVRMWEWVDDMGQILVTIESDFRPIDVVQEAEEQLQ